MGFSFRDYLQKEADGYSICLKLGEGVMECLIEEEIAVVHVSVTFYLSQTKTGNIARHISLDD